MPTNSSAAPDPTYDAASAAYKNAKNDMITNDALIRGTLESHHAKFDNAKKLHKAATTPAPPGNPVAPGSSRAAPGHRSAPGEAGGPATPPTTHPLRNNIFSGVKIASTYLHKSENHALRWPSAEDRASHMERISASALRAGMVLPTLQFEAFATLVVEPDANYYVVIAEEHPDNSMHAPIDGIQEPGMCACTPTVPHV